MGDMCPWCRGDSGIECDWDTLSDQTHGRKDYTCAACGKPVLIQIEDSDDVSMWLERDDERATP